MADAARTTAEVLGQFQKELAEAGIDPESAQYLIQSAGRELLATEGLAVRKVGRDG
ncbi:hypothetical protein ABZ135_18465 [Streptomyces sp. NPDC006339]|uniref:hypothetical protein n=1 Tax=Streptomyces sp. NPDC006339 TaxID=3156755 RepID=UPI0033B21617